MTTHSVRPEDILPDGDDTTTIQGKLVRKGSVAAFLANINIFESLDSSEPQKQAALEMIKTLAPTVIAVGLHQHVVFKNTQIEQILIEASASPASLCRS
ncbi:hypothetical protein [Legionella shakespearei]|uniref:Uncharacterized protein n=1 Tax=Legionella shakespearei DSM 23087 TaxID=1122169 RepID=A0A0W0YMN8_9GAMM|nr:hypothetical protein [Legionella shakespearei]KTD58144.1 hypothetical protein Lsha_2122 [Legionella shakespearei DSM 23087]